MVRKQQNTGRIFFGTLALVAISLLIYDSIASTESNEKAEDDQHLDDHIGDHKDIKNEGRSASDR